MSTKTVGQSRSFKAAADLSAKQFHIVKVTAADTVGLASAATDKIIGTIVGKPAAAAGAAVEVDLRSGGGTSKVIAGDTITAGDLLTANSDGEAITTTTTGNVLLGQALYDAVAGDIVEYMPMTDRY